MLKHWVLKTVWIFLTRCTSGKEVKNMGIIEVIAIILLIMWFGGIMLHIAGAFIHILLVLAIIVFLLRFIRKNAS